MKRQFSLLMGQKNALWWDLPAQESLELNRAIYGIERDALQKSCRRPERAARSAGQDERDGARAFVRRTHEDGVDLRAHS